MSKKKNEIVKKEKSPAIQAALNTLAKMDYYTPSMELLKTPKQIKFVYYYFITGFNGSEAVRKAGYDTKNAAVLANSLIRHPVVSRCISEIMEKSGFVDNMVEIELLKLANADIADYEPYLNGEMTLQELKESGVDTSFLSEAGKGTDKYGNPWGKVKLDSKKSILESIAKVRGRIKEAKEINIDNREQTIIINTNIPSWRDRLDESEIIDVESTTNEELEKKYLEKNKIENND